MSQRPSRRANLQLQSPPSQKARHEDTDPFDRVPRHRYGLFALLFLGGALVVGAGGFVVHSLRAAPAVERVSPPTKKSVAPLPVVAAPPDLGVVPDLAPTPDLLPAAAASDHDSAAETADYQRLVRDGQRLAENDDAEGAIRAFKKALALRPKGTEALFGLACARLDANESEADKLADRALKADTMNAEAYLAKGAIAQKQHRIPEARAAYRHYLYLAPKGQYAPEIRIILENLH